MNTTEANPSIAFIRVQVGLDCGGEGLVLSCASAEKVRAALYRL